MQTLSEFYAAYAELERSVGRLMTEWCGESCGLCTACCCRADICEEALQSAFLAHLLQEQGLSDSEPDERYGWLDLHGCSLAYGRPPVCYAYFCDELLSGLTDETARTVLRKLGMLMQHVGEEALNQLHLVEIMDVAALQQVDCARLFMRLNEARAALEVIEVFNRTGRLTADGRAALERISDREP
jgi:hypothetical protein